MGITFEDKIEFIYRQVKDSTAPFNSRLPEATHSLSEEEKLLFEAVDSLLSASRLIASPPMKFDDRDGIYQFRDIYFSRLVLPGDEGPPDYKLLNVQSLEKLTEDEAVTKKRNWLIESDLIAETLSENPSNEKITALQTQLGDSSGSPYRLIPSPDTDEQI